MSFRETLSSLLVANRSRFGASTAGEDYERQETLALWQAVANKLAASFLARSDPRDWAAVIADRAIENTGHEEGGPVWRMVRAAALELIQQDPLMASELPPVLAHPTLEQGVALRAFLRQKEAFLEDFDRNVDLWCGLAENLFGGVVQEIPPAAFEGEDDGAAFQVQMIDVLAQPGWLIECLIGSLQQPELAAANLFRPLLERIWLNVCRVSNVDPAEFATKQHRLILPSKADMSPSTLVDNYLAGTPFTGFFRSTLPFRVPFPARFEHTHIVGGTGHGKTQLLQLMIFRDLLKAVEGKGSVVVIDSQGDLIRTISHLGLFTPGVELATPDGQKFPSLADKLVLIDPNDVAYPPALNLFDLEMGDLARYDAADREKLLNGTIALYEYIFGALLGAELTNKQGVIFRYLARLMMAIPGATIHTLIELMEDGEPFRPFMAELDGSARRFFETQFFTPTFDDTKRQVLHRLWGVLSNPTLERMFSHPRNKVDLFEAMNSGKIVLINTAKDLLKSDGCRLFGRFFIALIAQAALQRAAIPEDRRRATFVYIDEAHEYFDDTIDELLNQARKFKAGLILAHQNLEQLSDRLRATIMASTSIKFAGGVSARDAAAFAKEMRCDPEFVQSTRKHAKTTEFACWIKNTTPRAIRIEVPLGVVGEMPRLDEAAYDQLIAANRARYAAPAGEGERVQPRPATASQPGKPGRGGFELGSPELL